MYKNLNATSLGLMARQSELIELALTYQFRSLDVDMLELQKRGLDAAKRFFTGTKLTLNFELPAMMAGDEAAFKVQLTQLQALAAFAEQLSAKTATLQIQPASDELPFHANFELHRTRLAEIANTLEPHGIQLAVGLLAAETQRLGKYYQFIYQPDKALLLLQSVGSKNVGLLLDVWHWFVGGGTVDQLKTLKQGQVASVRLADLPVNTDLATIKEDERLLPEDPGTIEIGAILQNLAENGYAGPVSIYPNPSRCGGLKRDALVAKVSQLLDDKMKAVVAAPAEAGG